MGEGKRKACIGYKMEKNVKYVEKLTIISGIKGNFTENS